MNVVVTSTTRSEEENLRLRAGKRIRSLTRGSIALPIAAVVITTLVALARVSFSSNYFYADDTQLGSVGLWYHLGDQLLKGTLPSLSPEAWQAGNYWAEGQWGLINPLSWAISIGTRLATDVAVWTTVVKITLLVIMSLGTYCLARSFGASPLWSSVAAIATPQTGFTIYMDAPSWVTGLMTTGLFPWAWWSLRRAARGRSPIPYLIVSYLLISVGYVFGTIALAILLMVCLADALMSHDMKSAIRIFVAAVWSGLWAVVIYLPGIMTAPVTERSGSGIINDFFLNADLGDLAAIANPSASATVGSWSGPATNAPLAYIAWFLPAVFMLWPWRRDDWRGLRTALVAIGTFTIIVTGPSTVGPLRWPIRFMPYVALALLIVFAVVLTRGFPQRVSWRGTRMTLYVVLVTSVLTWSLTPGNYRMIAFVAVAQACAALLFRGLAVELQKRDNSALKNPALKARSLVRPLRARVRLGLSCLLLALLALGQLGLQMREFPRTPLPTFAAPSNVEALRSVLAGVEGDVVTVGDAQANGNDPASFSEALIANQWYFSDSSVMNTYTVLPFTTFSRDLCMNLKGSTCSSALDTLLSVDDSTGLRVVDLLSVSSIIGYTATYPEPPRSLPSGWAVVATDTYTWRIARSQPIEPAGDVVWQSPGTSVQTVRTDPTSVTVRVDSVGSEGHIVLSRLAWPGYTVAGAHFAEPTRGYLLTVDLGSVPPGAEITVAFSPPATPIMVGCASVAMLLALGWAIGPPALQRRRVTRNAVPVKVDHCTDLDRC